jgi:hypothetical protein
VSGRLFNEKEVSEILKRASASEPGSATGISLEELQQIGAELGFDPAHIQLAAQQLAPATPSRSGFLNGRVILDRTVEGEVSPDDWQGMVGVIQRFHKGTGAITQRGANYDWAASSDEGGSLAVTVTVRNGRSRIRLESGQWMGILMATIFCPTFALVFSLSLAKHSGAWMAVPICLFFGALLVGLVRTFRQHHLQSVAGLLERLADEVQDSDHPLLTAGSRVEDAENVAAHARS